MRTLRDTEVAAASTTKRPRYVAIIADGHRRWAQTRDLPIAAGYHAGIETAKAITYAALNLGISELCMFTFSTENWRRPVGQVETLMNAFSTRALPETLDLAKAGARIRFLGRSEGLSPQIIRQMKRSEELTAANERMTLFVAFNYGGRAEVLDAARRFEGRSEGELRNLLYAPDMHDPDLIIRTGGDKRLSNFLLWQSAYTELVFRDEFWPDFTREAFEDSLSELGHRDRRFGRRTAPA